MENMIQDMINRGLANIESREILVRLPIWLAALRQYSPDYVYWLDYARANSN